MEEREPLRACGPGRWKLAVWAQPGAKKNEVAGMYQGRVKIRLSAPAVDNKANKALCGFVASALGLKPRQVTLDAGHGNRKKTLLIEADNEPTWAGVVPGDNRQT